MLREPRRPSSFTTRATTLRQRTRLVSVRYRYRDTLGKVLQKKVDYSRTTADPAAVLCCQCVER